MSRKIVWRLATIKLNAQICHRLTFFPLDASRKPSFEARNTFPKARRIVPPARGSILIIGMVASKCGSFVGQSDSSTWSKSTVSTSLCVSTITLPATLSTPQFQQPQSSGPRYRRQVQNFLRIMDTCGVDVVDTLLVVTVQ